MTKEYLFRRTPEYIEALWCFDSETSEEVLINLRTSEIIAKKCNGKIVDPSFPVPMRFGVIKE